MKPSFKPLFTICCFLLITLATFAQDDLQQKLPVDPQVKIGKLSNGLTYYIRKNSKPENKVELRLVVNAGSLQEDDDQQGLAHFTEHMSFNGTKNFKKNELVSFLQSIGVEFGADLNAYTSFNETVYILPIPTEKKENIEKGFLVLSDWAGGVTFEDEEIDKERGVVLEEARMGKGADDRMFRQLYPKIFENSKYANRLPIGDEEILETFKYDVIKRFYNDWYRPNLMAVIVVGDIEPAEAERLIKQYFSDLKNPAKQKARSEEAVHARTSSEGMVVTDDEATHHILQIFYPYKKEKEIVTFGDYKKFLVRQLFSSLLSQRMQELTQQAKPPFIGGGSYIGGWARGYEGFSSYAYIGGAGVETAVAALMTENERVRKFGFTQNELERTKRNFLKSIEKSYNERNKTESHAFTGEYVNHFLENEPIPGIENEFKYYQLYMRDITLDMVNQFAASTIPARTQPKLVVLTGPTKAEFRLPDNKALLSMVERASDDQVTPYEEKELATSLMEVTPSPGKIVSEKRNEKLGTTEVTFSNGVHVILKKTDFKNDQIILNASRFGGQHLYDAKDRNDAEFASAVISQMGVGQFSPMDLRKVLAGKSVRVSPRINNITESISGESSATDFEAMLQLTHLYFTQPRRDETLFQSSVAKQQATYQNLLASPDYTFQDSILRIMYKGHPWAPRLPNAQTFGELNLDNIMRIYQERFGNANGFTFVIVGSFEEEEAKQLAATYLGSLPARGVEPSFKDVGLRPVNGPLKKEIRKGTEPKSYIRLFFNKEAPYSEKDRLKLQAMIEVLNIKLIETLREDIGGIYSGGVSGGLSKYPYENFSLGIALPCGPKNVDRLIKATFAEIEKIRKDGPSEADLKKVKETWLNQYRENLKDNGFWAGKLIESVRGESDPELILDYEKNINGISTEDIKTVANKFVEVDRYVQVVLYPEKS